MYAPLYAIMIATGYIEALPAIKNGTANTALTVHQGKIFALLEACLPYQLSVVKKK